MATEVAAAAARDGQTVLPRYQWAGYLLVATTVTVFAACLVLLWGARDAERDKAATAAANLSIALTQDLARNIELYDLSLQGVVDGLSNPAVMAAPPELRHRMLFDRAATAPYLGSLIVTDEHGDVVFDAASPTPRHLNFADRAYFKAQASRPDLGLFISEPLQSRTDGQWIIALSRRLNKPDGSFRGVVAGTLRLAYLHDLFARLKLGPSGSLTLLRTDGTVIMREPFDPALLGQSMHAPELFSRLARARKGEYDAVSVVEGVPRLFHYQQVGDLPLVQNVGMAVSDIYADWWRKAVWTCALLSVCCAAIIALGLALLRELRHRVFVEASLLTLSEEDRLTGLANRRRLDVVLTSEWGRSVRTGTAFSVLMIDADRFKSYNDTYGHVAGDRLLQTLARAIDGGVRRPGDFVARYGGEEFLAVLPNTDAQSALVVAENVRQAVLALAQPHAGSSHGIATISIGVATMTPESTRSVQEVVSSADEALYEVKAKGRNGIGTANRDRKMSVVPLPTRNRIVGRAAL